MSTVTTQVQAPRTQNSRRPDPIKAGLPDPRPVTDYAVAVTLVGGNTRVTITLSQPCVVRTPHWGFIACDTGGTVFANSMTVVSNTQFYFDFAGTLNPAVGFIDVPYQDTQVQNFQGGFVRPGGKWFRAPVGP